MKVSLTLVATLLCCLVPTALAQPTKSRNLKLFSKTTYNIEPNIDLVLELNPEQEAILQQALQTRTEDESVKQARASYRGSQSLEDKGTLYRAEAEAKKIYQATVESILDESQRNLILAVDQLCLQAWREFSHIDDWPRRSMAIRDKMLAERLAQCLTPTQIARLGYGTPTEAVSYPDPSSAASMKSDPSLPTSTVSEPPAED